MIFEPREYETRLSKAQASMARQNLDVLLLTSEADVRYFSGFHTRFWESPSRSWFLLIPQSDKPIAVIPSIGETLMRSTWIKDIRTWRAPDLRDDGVTLLNDTLDEVLGNKEGRVGLPFEHESNLRMPLGDFLRLCKLNPKRHYISDNNIVRRLRAIKSRAEIEKIEMACAIAGRVFARIQEVIKIGISEKDVFRNFQRLCLEEGADFVPYLAGGFGQNGYNDVISPASKRYLEHGEIIMLDTGLQLNGYFTDFNRNFALVKSPVGAVQDCYKRLLEATSAGFNAAKPGARVCDLFMAMDKVMTGGKNNANSGRFGHGLGMQLTEWPSLIPQEETVLEEGMVLTLEPSGETSLKTILVHEENIVITSKGARYLSPLAPDTIPILVSE